MKKESIYDSYHFTKSVLALSIMRLLLAFLVTIPLLVVRADDSSHHLFILSGQANMTDELKEGFATTVEGMIGKKPEIVFHRSKNQGIRFWVKDYQLPENHPMANLSKDKANGEELTKLVELVKKSYDSTKFKSVHLIWMQGESDASRNLGVAYERSFKLMLEDLKKELGIKKLNFIIGRLGDHGLRGDAQKKEAWKRVRQIQEKLATDDPNGKWIDTDDFKFIAEKNHHEGLNDPKAEAMRLGARFGKAVLIQIAEGS